MAAVPSVDSLTGGLGGRSMRAWREWAGNPSPGINPWDGRPGAVAGVSVDVDVPKLSGEHKCGSSAGVAGGGSGIDRDPSGRGLGSAVECRLVRLLPHGSLPDVSDQRPCGHRDNRLAGAGWCGRERDAYWGRRQQAQASRDEGFLAGVIEAAAVVAAGDSPTETLVDHVGRQLVEILNLDDCVFRSTISSELPVLQPDGTVARNGKAVDIDRSGLPTDSRIQLLAQSGGTIRGEFLLTAATHMARPSLEARRVAVTLADQVAAAIATSKPNPASMWPLPPRPGPPTQRLLRLGAQCGQPTCGKTACRLATYEDRVRRPASPGYRAILANG
jgi:hypothetical protein